jgi:hypothetical protein
MTGYATSAQALEILVGDTRERYVLNEETFRKEARKQGFWVASMGLVAAISAGLTFSPTGIHWKIANVITAGLCGNASRTLYRRQKELLRHADECGAVADEWSERETKHPLQLFPDHPHIVLSRYVPPNMRPIGTIAAYDTLEQLLDRTNERHFGLINAVPTEPSKDKELCIERPGYMMICHGTKVSGLDIELPIQYREGRRVLIVGNKDETGAYRHLWAQTAIETDTYYRAKDLLRKNAPEPVKGLLWTPELARVLG